jgi:hypothetical protein
MPIIPTTFDAVVQVAIAIISAMRPKSWWIDRCGLLARRHTYTVRLLRDAEQGGT